MSHRRRRCTVTGAGENAGLRLRLHEGVGKMKRIVSATAVALLLGVFALAQQASPALAGWEWCANDPVLIINGNVYHIIVGANVDSQADRGGTLTIHVPAGSNASVSGVNAADGIGRLRLTVILVYDSRPGTVRAEAWVPHGTETQITVTQAPGGPVPAKYSSGGGSSASAVFSVG